MFEIGSSLREARLRQGIEFPQIEAATKIRGKYLRALEDEQFGQLPSQTYVKGFLRTYAEHLGLDGQLYVDEFNSRYVVGEDDPPIRVRRSARSRPRRHVQSNVLVAALVGIALVTGLVIAAWTSGSPDREPLVGVDGRRETTQAAPVRADGPASITFRAVRPVFLTIRKNAPTGRVVFEGPLARGEAENFTAKRLWVNTGTPENLRVTVNRKRVSLRGGSPDPFYLTARGVSY